MPTAEALVETKQPARYLIQLGRHASQMTKHRLHRPRAHGGGHETPQVRHAEWSDTEGNVVLSWGQWTMQVTPGLLTLRAEAADEESLRRITELVTTRLEKIGRRDKLTVLWRPTETR